jgi:hypothetical protein
MAERSAFRDFIRKLKEDWRVTFPLVRPLDERLSPSMPKASTFYAGIARPLRMHTFLNFQHSSKAWEVGEFTINVILSNHKGPPEGFGWLRAPEGAELYEGSHRIGRLVGGKDKWWHLKRYRRPPIGIEAWRPSTYDDYDAVLREAVADVTRDVGAVLRKLGFLEEAESGTE